MSDEKKSLNKIVLARTLRLNAVVFGLTSGLLFGLAIFVATNWLVIKGGEVVGPHLKLLGEYFIGYKVTFWGSVIGLFYGFVVGFLIGFLLAKIYNWLVKLRNRNEQDPL